MEQYESTIEFVNQNKGKLFLEGFEVVKLDSFIESEFDKEPCYQVIKFIGCPPRFYFEEVPIIIGLTPLEHLPDYLDIVAHWDMNFERVGVVSNFAHTPPKDADTEALNKHNVMGRSELFSLALVKKAFETFRYRGFPHNHPTWEEWAKENCP